jgi:hypothetical protein
MFAFLVDDGVAVKAASEADAAELLAREGARFFTYNEMPMRGWVVLPLAASADVGEILDAVQRAYESVV